MSAIISVYMVGTSCYENEALKTSFTFKTTAYVDCIFPQWQ